VFQQPFLIPYLSVIENVLVPIEKPGSADIARAQELLEQLEIADLAPKFPNECSGGERVRVAMARGLVHRPDFLFVDEPTASLDSATGAHVMRVLKTQREHGALLVITHDLEILDDADIIFRMRDGVSGANRTAFANGTLTRVRKRRKHAYDRAVLRCLGLKYFRAFLRRFGETTFCVPVRNAAQRLPMQDALLN
jgi:putative ABC transport system ATP-binding protein